MTTHQVFGQLEAAVTALPSGYPGKDGYKAWIADARAKYASPPDDVEGYITGLKAAGTALREKRDVPAVPAVVVAPAPAAPAAAGPAAPAGPPPPAAPAPVAPASSAVAASSAAASDAASDAAPPGASLLPLGPDQNLALQGSKVGTTEQPPGGTDSSSAAAPRSGEASEGEDMAGGRGRRSSRKTGHRTPKRKKLSRKKSVKRK